MERKSWQENRKDFVNWDYTKLIIQANNFMFLFSK